MTLITWFGTTGASIISFLFTIYVILSILGLILDNQKNSSETLAWIFVILLLPFLGIIIYLIFGRDWRYHNKKIRKQINLLLKRIMANLKNVFNSDVKSNKQTILKNYQSYDANRLLNLVKNSLNQEPVSADSVKIIDDGHIKFKTMIEDLKTAKEFIHMEYFIWTSSHDYPKKIQKILMQKAREGVEVRIMHDLWGFKKSDRKKLEKAGVKVASTGKSIDRLNRRNHCKIVIIDGKIGYTGGMNMADEYATGGKKFPEWRDTHLRIVGNFCSQLQIVFSVHWLLATNEKLVHSKYFKKSSKKQGIPLILAYSGPESERNYIHETLVGLIFGAKKSIKIQSPYFILDKTMANALKIASLSGIDVEIVLAGPKNIDKKIPFYAAHTFFEDLLKTGIKIYHYMPGFYHTKGIIIDDKLASIGTANMDVRSFRLNQELNVLMFDTKKSKEALKLFEKDVERSRQFTLKDYQSLGIFKRLRNGFCRLLSGSL